MHAKMHAQLMRKIHQNNIPTAPFFHKSFVKFLLNQSIAISFLYQQVSLGMINKNVRIILIICPIEAQLFHNKRSVTGTPDKCFNRLIETYKSSQVTLMKGKLVWVKHFYPCMT